MPEAICPYLQEPIAKTATQEIPVTGGRAVGQDGIATIWRKTAREAYIPAVILRQETPFKQHGTKIVPATAAAISDPLNQNYCQLQRFPDRQGTR